MKITEKFIICSIHETEKLKSLKIIKNILFSKIKHLLGINYSLLFKFECLGYNIWQFCQLTTNQTPKEYFHAKLITIKEKIYIIQLLKK